jgi:hypothetical protein
MAKPPRPWIVNPHSPFQKLEPNLWTVDSTVPNTPVTRRMTIIRRSDGTLMFFQAVPLEDKALEELSAWGRPSILIVPHDQHGIDATPFATKLGLKIYGPKKTEAKMRAKFDLAGTFEDVPADPTVSLESMEGSRTGEPVCIVRSPGGRVSYLFADAYQANDSERMPLSMRILGFGGGPRVVPVFKMLFCSDKPALKAHLERLASAPGLAHVVPCHGRIESKDPAGSLRKAITTV